MMGLLLFVGVLALIAWFFVGIFNRLVTHRNRFKNAFAQIDVQLQRRYELIPNLVEAVKAYLGHEKETLTQVIAARNQAASLEKILAQNAGNAEAMAKFAQAEGVLTGALGKLMMVSEAYPDLKANTTIQNLMEELKTTENRVGFARQAFNDAVMVYNIEREKFPNSLVAAFGNFQQALPLEISHIEAREPVRISF